MKEEPHYPPIDPELEARIVALVLGEASDFESEELNRLIEQRPELAAFKTEMQSVHGLLRDVATGETTAADDNWKLSAEKRNAVLAVISGETKEQPKIQLAHKPADSRSKQTILLSIAKIAAVLLVAAFFGSMWISSLLRRSSVSTAQFKQLGLAMHNYHPAATKGMSRQWGAIGAAPTSPGAHILMSDGAVAMTMEEVQAAEFSTATEHDYKKSSKSSLSGIRESLGADRALPSPYYLQDDVQYYPATPKFSVPREETASGEPPATEKPTRAPGAGVGGPGPGPVLPVADDLTVIPQSIDSSGAAASKGAWAWQDSSFFYSGLGDDGDSNSGGEKEEASKRVAGLGMGNRPVAEGKSESAPELARPALGSQESGASQSNRKPDEVMGRVPERTGRIAFGAVVDPDAGVTEAKPSAEKSSQGLTGGTNLRFSRDFVGDSPAAGKEIDFDGDARDGEGRGSERYRVDGIAAAGADRHDVSAEMPEERVERDLGAWHSAGSAEVAPSKPMEAGTAGRKRDAEKTSRYEDFGTDIPADSIPSPTNEPMSAREDLNKKEVADGFAKVRSALRKSRLLDQGESNGRQIPVPVVGTPIGPPRGALQLGQANQDPRWDKRVKTRPGGPAGLKKNNDDALPGNSREGAEAYGERLPSNQKVERGESLWNQEQILGYRNVLPRFMSQENVESKTRAPVRKSVAPAGLNEKSVQDEAFSTFSLHVSDVSFKLARAALASGSWPEAAKVRIEEFVNAFDYGDPMPSQSEKVACRVEQSVHPFLQQRNLLRVSMRTAAAGRSSNTPLRLTFLLDNSGSMERIDRQQTVRRAFALLAQQLKPIDQVTLISFARQPRLLADKVSGAESQQLVQLIENLPSEGGTNMEAALQLAFEKAQEQRVDNAQNRIILLTDGAVNLGDANPDSLSRMIVTMRGAGIAFDAAGISAEGLNDEILEALTCKGDGRYYLLDSLEAADDGFARQIAGALRPSAKNVKVQIEFNPKRVGRYKLLGFEKHILKKEDFRNDKVDAAEMAAAEAGVAVYQFEAKPDGEGDVGSVSVRFLDVSTGQMIENCWPIPYEPDAPRLDQAAPSLRIAASAALLAAKLRGEALGQTVDLKTLSNLIAGLPDQDRNADRVGQLQQMIEQARQVSGK